MTDVSEIFVPAFEADVALAALIPGGIYQAASLGVGDSPQVPARRYLVWNELASLPAASVRELSNAQFRTFQFWVYDDPGDYSGINQVLNEVRRVCRSLAFVKVGAYVVMGQEWLGLSGLFPADPAYHVISRNGSARFAVNQ